ncbi:MAG: hypothetical protein LAT62_13430 [Natronospirillum sp.]|uniref:hypothetical protein n=1 Tax=Natronospirillum sp. TaxID=2812955 RepID=UPI0025E05B98|nr:hypothetical protein [Natronospirillum sp.]MCH8552935.1 hypothetical protein [Natronospirillum sp.]
MTSPHFDAVGSAANKALQSFADSLGLEVEDLESASSDVALGNIVDRLTTIGVNAKAATEGSDYKLMDGHDEAM